MTLRIFIMREKLNLFCINLVSMPYIGGNKYSLMEIDEVKKKFVHGQGRKRFLLSNFILWIVMNFCYIQNKIIIGQEVHVEENIVLEDYVEVKGQSIEIYEEINEGLVMEEDPLIKIIVEENNEDPIIEKDLEVKMVETIN